MPAMTLSDAISAAIRSLQAGDLARARSVCAQVLAGLPEEPNALHVLGLVERRAGRREEAVSLLQRAAARAPQVAEFHNSLGGVLAESGRSTEARACFERALRLRPDYAEARANLGGLARQEGFADEAARRLEETVASDPTNAAAWRSLAVTRLDLADAPGAVACYRRAVELRPDDAGVHGELLYAMQFAGTDDPDAIFGEHRRWAERHADPLTRAARPHDDDHAGDAALAGRRRLRVGYVSGDFREHPTARFLAPLLANHDPGAVEVFCHSDATGAGDAVTRRLRGLVGPERWRDAAALSDAALAEAIRADRIDVLIDPTGHMAGNRALVFARRPAPLQVAYPGYPGTTGMVAMDACLTDEDRDPPGSERWYIERLLRIPLTAQAYCPDPASPADDAASEASVGLLPAESAGGHVTFACLNNPAKITPATLDLWAGVLGAVPRSRLLLLTGPRGRPIARVVEGLALRGVDAAESRVEWLPRVPRGEYLAYYARRVDVALDAYPYAGHTTTLDALWMGVPTVTRVGPTHVTREGYALLKHVGLDELAATTDAEYVATAARLAGDVPRLRALRGALRDRLRASPLMDGAGLARRVETALRQV